MWAWVVANDDRIGQVTVSLKHGCRGTGDSSPEAWLQRGTDCVLMKLGSSSNVGKPWTEARLFLGGGTVSRLHLTLLRAVSKASSWQAFQVAPFLQGPTFSVPLVPFLGHEPPLLQELPPDTDRVSIGGAAEDLGWPAWTPSLQSKGLLMEQPVMPQGSKRQRQEVKA